MRLIIATAADATMIEAIQAYKEIKNELQNLTLEVYAIQQALNEKQWGTLQKEDAEKTMLLIDSHGADEGTVNQLLGIAFQKQWDVVPLMFSMEVMRFFKIGAVSGKDLVPGQHGHMGLREDIQGQERGLKMRDLGNFMQLFSYWRVSGRANWKNSLRFISAQYAGGQHEIEPPFSYPDIGIIDPFTDKYFEKIEDYQKAIDFDPSLPTVAFIYMSAKSRLDPVLVLQDFTLKLKGKANVLPIGLASMMNVNAEILSQLLTNQQMPVELIVNFMNFRLGSGPEGLATTTYTNLFKQLNVPVVHPILMSSVDIEEWEKADFVYGPSEQFVSIILPELDGVIDSLPVAAMKAIGEDDEFQVQMKVLAPIEERVEKMVNRIVNWLNLRRLANENKRVAIIGYNYPVGEGNLFGGAYLDTFQSIEKILHTLYLENYNVTPFTAKEMQTKFIENGLTNGSNWFSVNEEEAIFYPTSHYEQFLASSPWKEEIEAKWGKAPGNVLVKDGQFFIPGLLNGNVFIGIQPPRATEIDSETYHSGDLPPTHQYIAYYQWIHEVFQADVILHVGTHGTLEFLPGKQVTLSGNCYSDALIGDVPHLYYYYVGNVAEGMIAKRRSSATLLTYQAPPFEESELYGQFADLSALLQEYMQAEKMDSSRAETVRELICEQAEKLQLPTIIDELEEELYRIQTSFIPNGLHIFGEGFSEQAAIDFTYKIVSMSRANVPSIQQAIAVHKGLDYEELVQNGNIQVLKEIDAEAKQIVKDFLTESLAEVDEPYRAVLNYAKEIYDQLRQNNEEKGLLNGLNGGYLEAKLAGDIIRNPEILPTGNNMIQIDPTLIPSESAIRRGTQIAENSLASYLEEHGVYPKSVGLILWGIETARTQGETIGQILHYVGARLVPKPHSFEKQLEIIPLEELGRPRINVFINASGIFRDMFPNLIDELSDMFEQISFLNEPSDMNFVKAETERIRAQLGDTPNADNIATGRIFAPALGEYDSGVTHMVHENKWEEDAEIGQLFATNRNYVYTKKVKGEQVASLYDEHAKSVDVISQIRSEFEHEVVDLDHYFEYFGGLSKAVENVKGEQVDILISDSTSNQVVTEKLANSLERGVRTRLTNPKWVKGLLEHEYAGGQAIAERFNNILGLAATTNAVNQWVFDDLHEMYVENEEIAQQLEQNNPYAYENILHTMLTYNEHGYWQASEEQLEQIKEKYLELESSIE